MQWRCPVLRADPDQPARSSISTFAFFIRRLLDARNAVACGLCRQDQFVEFQLQGQRVAVLRCLDQKDHQERHDCRARVDDELPGIAEAE